MYEFVVNGKRGQVVVYIHIKLNREPCVGVEGEVVFGTSNFKISGTVVSEIALQGPLAE